MTWRESLWQRAGELELRPEELRRYSRHLVIPEMGMIGQKRLKAARVLVVGLGGLGSPAAAYLAAAGIGGLGLVDPDVVGLSNLQRQIFYREGDLGKPKVVAAAEWLAGQNPHLRVTPMEEEIHSGNVLEQVREFDLVIDGTDNFPVRYLLNDACFFAGRPLVHGSLFRFDGRVAVFHADPGGPCYRCLQPEPPDPGTVPTCAEGGVLGALAGVIGSMQALEAIKCITGVGPSPAGKLWRFDVSENRFRETRITPDPACALCGESPAIRDMEESAARPECISASAFPCAFRSPALIRETGGDLERIQLLDIRSPAEVECQPVAGALCIPLACLPDRLDELDSSRDLAVLCSGSERTRQALQLLADAGFKKAFGVEGGVEAWVEG